MIYKLEEWLQKLQSRNFSVRLGLDNIKLAASSLSLIKPAPYVVTVAGTNGKGSVTKLLESLLFEQGFRTGCYTSPHLIKFNERISINKNLVLDSELVSSFQFIDKKLQEHKLDLTYFEFITLAAWHIFLNHQLDIVILEIGLGGRLDAVNAIPKDLAIITSVDYDHQKFLGHTLEEIGFEKAGVITDAKPVILGDSNMPSSVIKSAKMKTKEVYQFGKDYFISIENELLNFSTKENYYKAFCINQFANIKYNNIATGIKALQVIDKYYRKCLNIEHINKVLQNFNLLGRCSWLNKKSNILLDVAHNKQSIENLAHYLCDFKFKNNKKIIALCGMLADKDIASCFKAVYQVIDYWHLVTINEHRGETAENLAKIILSIDSNIKYKVYDNINNSYELVYNFLEQKINNDSILVVFGSFHTVGPIYEYIQQEKAVI